MRSFPSFVAFLVLLPIVTGAAQLDQPKWTVTLNQDVDFWEFAPGDILLVGTEGAILALDEHTGKELWRRSGLPAYVGPEEGTSSVDVLSSGRTTPATTLKDVDVLWDVDDAVLTFDSGGVHSHIEVWNLRDGTRRWASEGLPFDDLRGYVRASPSLLLLFGTAGTAGAPEQVLVGVDLDAGRVRWRRRDVFTTPPIEFEVNGSGLEASRGTISGNQWPVLEGDTAAILFWSAEGLINIDLRTGERIWATRLDVVRPPAISQDYPALLVSDRVLYAPFDHSLQAFSLSDGHPLWSEARRFIAKVAQLELTPAGLLVRGTSDWAPLLPSISLGAFPAGRFIDLLDPATGASRWPHRDKPLAIMTRFVLDGDRVYGATYDTLYRIDLASGAVRAIAGLKFKDHGFPMGLEVRHGGLLVKNTQTLMLFDTTGAQVYATHVHPSSLFRLTRFSRDYAYMMTDHADSSGHGPGGLLKINKDTGKPELRAPFGSGWGAYRLDDSLALLFRLQHRREIDCYRF